MVPLVVIFDKTCKQEILRKNIEVGTIFEVVTSFGVILYFAFGTNLEAGTNLEVFTHYQVSQKKRPPKSEFFYKKKMLWNWQ